MSVVSLPITAREIKATERRLEAIYSAARLGLKGDALALSAGLLPVEFNRLCEFDPMARVAEQKGRADAERELSEVLHNAARAGDAKAALEILKHQHNWTAAQRMEVSVEQRISITAALQAAERRVIEGYATIDETPERANAPGLLTSNSTQEVERGYAQSNSRTPEVSAEL